MNITKREFIFTQTVHEHPPGESRHTHRVNHTLYFKAEDGAERDLVLDANIERGTEVNEEMLGKLALWGISGCIKKLSKPRVASPRMESHSEIDPATGKEPF